MTVNKIKKEGEEMSPTIGNGYIGEETKLGMKTDFLNVNLDGVGTISFTTPQRPVRSRKSFESTFKLDGSAIHGSLVINVRGGSGEYSVQFAEIKTNRFVTTKLSGTIDNATAREAIEIGWAEFRRTVEP